MHLTDREKAGRKRLVDNGESFPAGNNLAGRSACARVDVLGLEFDLNVVEIAT